MTVDIIDIPTLLFEKVRYYSVLLENKTMNEFRDFQTRMASDVNAQIELAEINWCIKEMGEKTSFFQGQARHKDIGGYPSPCYQFFWSGGINDYGLRLYYIRLSPFIVILLNGDRKTALEVKDCSKCFPHFDKAQKLTLKIAKAIKDGFLKLDKENKQLILNDDFELTL